MNGSFSLPRFLVLSAAAFVSFGAIFYGGYYPYASLIAVPESSDANIKVVYSIRWLFLPLIILALAIGRVASLRFLGYARNPLSDRDDVIQLDKNVLQNTLEQFTVHVFTALALMTYLEREELRLIPLHSLNFVIARIIYRLGYPSYRTWGFMMGTTSNFFIIGLTAYFMFTRGFV